MSEPIKIAANLEDAAVAMAARVTDDGDDWRVKITRRASPASPPESVAIFDGATMEQLLSPEPWLSKLSGGGAHYNFRVVHAKDRSIDRPTAFYTIPAIPGAPQSPDINAARSPGWNGPTTLIYPESNVRSNGVTKWPGASDAQAAPRQPASHDAGGSAGPLLAEVQRERAAITEERHRMEMDAIRRQSEEDRKRLEAKFNDVLAELRTARDTPRTSIEDTLTKITAAFVPLLSVVAPLIADGRKSRLAAEDARIAREETNRVEMLKMMEKMNEKASNASQDTVKIVTPMVDAVAQMGRTVLQHVTMMREMTAEPPQDDSIMSVLKAAIGAWVEASSRNSMPPSSMVPQPRLAPTPTGPQIAAMPAGPAPVAETSEGGDEVEVDPAQMLDILSEEVGKHAEARDLAESFVEALAAPDFVAAIQAEGGVMVVLRKRLGESWANDAQNVAYLQTLFGYVEQIAAARGVDLRVLQPKAA